MGGTVPLGYDVNDRKLNRFVFTGVDLPSMRDLANVNPIFQNGVECPAGVANTSCCSSCLAGSFLAQGAVAI